MTNIAHTANNTFCIAPSQYKMNRAFSDSGVRERAVMIGSKININAAKRLRTLRERAGYKTAQAFCDAHEDRISVATYRSHENGTRNISTRAAKLYAPLLSSTYTWILDGEGEEVIMRNGLTDGEIALTDAVKNLLQIVMHHGLATEESLNRAFSYQIEHYREKKMPDAITVMSALSSFVASESTDPEKPVLRRLLKLPAKLT